MDIDALEQSLLNQDRASLSRAITLVESQRPDHRDDANQLLSRLLPHSGKAIRLGITGVPGVGKSTLIDNLGITLIEQGHKVAVLAIDPSSSRSGGSILGDKTRMERLSHNQNAFIRPSPSSGTLGGVGGHTRDAMILCEAAGFDVVIVETVGVGQSETTIADLTDCFLLLALPGAGDELQGIKKGIIELADVIAVNKADGDYIKTAQQAARHLQSALHILDHKVPVLTVSGLSGEGLRDLWKAVKNHIACLESDDQLQKKRSRQDVSWMWRIVEEQVLHNLKNHPKLKHSIHRLEQSVQKGEISALTAAGQIDHMLNCRIVADKF